MFEFLFKYSPAVFRKGEFVLLGSWSVWALAGVILAAVAGLAWLMWGRRQAMSAGMTGSRKLAIWCLQALLVSLLLALLWQPAIRISTLKTQQNVVAIVVDDSRSMALEEDGQTRSARAVKALSNGLLKDLGARFQVRMYRMGPHLERIRTVEELSAAAQATRISDSMKQLVAEAASLPIGAVVLLSDGADNSGGIDLEAVAELRSRRLPVHAIGFGRERFEKDIEISDVHVPARALPGSRLVAQVTFRQRGYSGRDARISLREAGKVLASSQVEIQKDGALQTETLLFNAGEPGAHHLEISMDPLDGEENLLNNKVSRLVNVEASQPRVLYVEGEPRWEFKFIRRALQGDRTVQLVSMLRTTQNKIYRQGISEQKELEEGFPGRVEDLFSYQGLVIGSVEAGYFTSSQQELIREFVDRRGGGVLFLGGRAALADGGYRTSPLADIVPTYLPERPGTFQRDRVPVSLTPAGRDSVITRLVEDPEQNAERWAKLPQLADYQDTGEAKPGATVLAELSVPGGRQLPLLVTQNFGHGRTALFATGGSWRWQMRQELADRTHEVFWQQLLRWLVTGTAGRVSVSTPKQVLSDESRVELTAVVRDKTYLPVSDARVEARIMGPGGSSAQVELTPDPHERGIYRAVWDAGAPGAFLAEVVAHRADEVAGRDVLTFRREDGVAENFHAEQNRELLEKLAEQTGGGYYTPAQLDRLAEEITFSEAGITVRETKDLWNMPAVFLLLILLKSAEWFLRRRWGVV